MISREQRVLRKNLKETLKTKNILIEMKTDFDGFANGLDTAQKKILELQIMSKETFKTKSKRERCLKNEQNIQELWYNYQRYSLVTMGRSEEKREGNRRNI